MSLLVCFGGRLAPVRLRLDAAVAPSPHAPDRDEAQCGEAMRAAVDRWLRDRIVRVRIDRMEAGDCVGDAAVSGASLTDVLLGRELAVPRDGVARGLAREELRRACAASRLLEAQCCEGS